MKSKMKCPPKSKKRKQVPQKPVTIVLEEQKSSEVTMGRRKLTINTACKHTYFTWDERLILQYYYNGTNKYQKITSPTLLGRLLCKNEKTIRRELKRGLILHVLGDLPFERWEYNADHAQRDADLKATAKGPQTKLGYDRILAKEIANLIKNKHYSPYAIIQYFNKHKWPSSTRICEKTIYNYIEAGYIPGVTIKNLTRKGKSKHHKKKPKQHARIENARRTIEKRPKEIKERREFGHWEGDTVYSCKNKSKAGLFTLTERKTRAEIVVKIPNRKAKTIVAALDQIERSLGSKKFRFMFKSITFDNGVEFSYASALEHSSITKKARTTLYFAHPYCSSERGLNENHNGIIRRFLPKGTDFKPVAKKNIKEVQDWMNSYPRKILDGRTPFEALQEEIKQFYPNSTFLEAI